MTCKDMDELMVMAVYAEAEPEEQRSLDFHLQHCSDCEAKYRALREDLAGISENVAEVPAFDWAESGHNIHAVLAREKKKHTRSRLFSGAPWKTAAAVGIFCLGILVGWLAFHNPSLEVGEDADLSGRVFSLLDRHLGTVRISLLGYVNLHDPADRPALFLFEQSQARQLLFQNRLLISHFHHGENQKLIGLLDSLNFILQEISNLPPEETESLMFIKTLLKDSDILFRIDDFHREGIRDLSAKERL
jgi:hypothetical protein